MRKLIPKPLKNWRLDAESWKKDTTMKNNSAAGAWKMESGRSKVEIGRWKLENGDPEASIHRESRRYPAKRAAFAGYPGPPLAPIY